MNFPKKLHKKITDRVAQNALRKFSTQHNLIDFSSNDYLGFSKSKTIFDNTHQYLITNDLQQNGATGSRLLSGNNELYNETEQLIAKFHDAQSATIFNSGYDANIGFFSGVPQRRDIILYDQLIHASIRDGIRLSNAQSYSFKHNDLEDLQRLITRHSELVSESHHEVYVVTESVFSMDGDSPDLVSMTQLLKKYNAYLIVDEAHALGVFGQQGSGEIQRLKLENAVFARIVTYGKALGCHGSAILGSNELKTFLVNFARSLIYTTGLSPHAVATIKTAYEELSLQDESQASEIKKLSENIQFFKSCMKKYNLENGFISSDSAIHCYVISGNEKVKAIATKFYDNGYDVKAILSPTVPKGEERLRFCLHSYNSEKEIEGVLQLLSTFV